MANVADLHQRTVLRLADRFHAMLDTGAEAASRPLPDLHREMAAALRDYQLFKHERIFDPAVADGGAETTRLGRAMKMECIAAGEVFRSHVQQWKADRIAADWPRYRTAARLTLNALRRHLENERDGIETLLRLLPDKAAGDGGGGDGVRGAAA